MRPWTVVAVCICLLPAMAKASDPENPTKETFDRGIALYDAGKYEDAYKVFHSIEDEDVAAAFNVGFMKRKGQGTQKDPKGAEERFERAAKVGDPKSMAELGEMLLQGEAGKPDPKAAARWLAFAAAAHHPIAEFELGELYESGRGVPKDLAVAGELYADAAARGVPGAKERLAALPLPAPSAPPAQGSPRKSTSP
jgi:TPR repeat protein